MLDRVAAGIVAVGVIIGGGLIGHGFSSGRAADSFVSVKGVSEREVRADLAIWPIRLAGADDDLAGANRKVAVSVAGVKMFLARHGIDTTQLELVQFTVTDAYANPYGPDRRPTNRFVINQTVLVRSTKPELVLAASQQVSDLAAVGVAASSGDEYRGGSGPTFVFTGLNGLKPAMIAEATARAREAAEQFARDAQSDVGSIRQANQGVFEILARDQAPGISEESQINKTVRVVSTVSYFLR
jgi:hypothetical protein